MFIAPSLVVVTPPRRKYHVFCFILPATTVTTKVYGIVAGVPIPYVTPPDACTGCNLNCPLAAGGNFTYINTFPVLKEYPPVCVNLFQALLVFVDLNSCRVVSNKCLYLHPI